jgi:hypothetical protein
MNCNEFHVRLDQVLETRASVDVPELKPHVLECAECRAIWEDCLLLEPTIENWNQPAERDVDLVDGVMDQLSLLAATSTSSKLGSQDTAVDGRPKFASREQAKRAWVVVVLASCLLAACVIAFEFGGNQPRIADNNNPNEDNPNDVKKKHVVPDDLSNGPFNKNNTNGQNNKTGTQVALLERSEVEDMMNDAQTGIESLGDSVREQVAGLRDIVPSNFDVWDKTTTEDDSKNAIDVKSETPDNAWLKRLFDTAENFDPETT